MGNTESPYVQYQQNTYNIPIQPGIVYNNSIPISNGYQLQQPN